jgi:uncharacterized membrane protein
LVEGVQVPLSFRAALGVTQIADRQRRAAGGRWLAGLVLAVLVPTNGLLVAGNCLALRGQPAPIYQDAGEVVALDWLDARVEPDDVVLAAYETGNYLPARVGARAFVGHGPESVRASEKKALVARFFDAATDGPWREELLMQYGVDYVFWGPAERALGGFDPGQAAYLRLAYEAGEYAIFGVER